MFISRGFKSAMPVLSYLCFWDSTRPC